MMRAIIVSLMLMSGAALAQEPATTDSFARCAALAEASAIQHRDIVKDLDAADNIQRVADGYRFAAMLATDPVIENSKVHVEQLVAEQLPEFQAKLTKADDVAKDIFKADTTACAAIEPQAYALIKKFNDFQAKKAN